MIIGMKAMRLKDAIAHYRTLTKVECDGDRGMCKVSVDIERIDMEVEADDEVTKG